MEPAPLSPDRHKSDATIALQACYSGKLRDWLRTASGYSDASERLGLTFEADTPVDASVDRDGSADDFPL